MRKRLLSLPALAMMVVGCSAAGLLNGVTPSATFDREKDIPYGSEARQTLDVYRAETPKADAPVIVFVYGGGWTRGEKSMYKFVAEGFTKDGYDVVVPNYRLYPETVYPEMIRDTGKAVNVAADLFPDRPLVLMGHSAGAYNVLMSALAPDLSGVDVCNRVVGVISLAAPTGAYPMTDEPYISIFPDRFKSEDAPINRVQAASPPIMLVNGKADETVGFKNATELSRALQAEGKDVTLKIYEDMNHIDPVRRLSRHFDGGSPLKGDILTFIDGLAGSGESCAS